MDQLCKRTFYTEATLPQNKLKIKYHTIYTKFHSPLIFGIFLFYDIL